MALLDPPPNRELVIDDVARAFDILLSAAGGPEHFPLVDRDICGVVTLSAQIGFLADVYRALLLSAHLLLEMRVGDADTTVVLSLRSTKRRCKALLRVISTIGQTTLPSSRFQLLQECFEISANGKRALISLDDEDVGELQGEEDICHHAVTNQVQVEKKTEILAGTSQLAASQGLVPDYTQGSTSVSNALGESDDSEKGRTVPLSFDRRQLAEEENTLLDIAFPFTKVKSQKTCVEWKGCKNFAKKRKFESIGDVSSYDTVATKRNNRKSLGPIKNITPLLRKTGVVKEGWLVLEDFTNKHDNERSKSTGSRLVVTRSDLVEEKRCFVRLLACGILFISVGPVMCGSPEKTIMLYLQDGCMCEAVAKSSTFHFQIKGVQPIQCHLKTCICSAMENNCFSRENDTGATSFDRTLPNRQHHAIGTVRVLFSVDETTGGGLAEGFSWVSTLSEIAASASTLGRLQHFIRQEWGDSEWQSKGDRHCLHIVDAWRQFLKDAKSRRGK